MRAFKDEAVEKIRKQVGKGRVICGLSGGVDSAVAAVLIHEAIGEQLTCVFVDHGLLRLNEGKTVVDLFRGHYNIPLVHVDASAQFLGALEGTSDPEAKRKTIGRLFIDVFEAEAKKIGGAGVPGAGHALSRRDRERVVHRRAVRHHQVAPQRRRLAGAHEHEARRAAPRAVQGRGSPARPRARPSRGVRRPPSVPGPGPRHPLPGRDHAGEARHPPPRRRHLHRRNPKGRPLRRDLAGLRRHPSGENRRRHGRRPHL